MFPDDDHDYNENQSHIQDHDDHDHGDYGWLFAVSVLALAIFLSNLVVLLAIVKNKLLHIPNNVFVASMALADASFGAVGLPLRMISSSSYLYNFDSCYFINSIYLLLLDTPQIMIFGMTLDRFFAIRFPFKYHRHIECKHAIIACVLLFIIATTIEVSIPRLFIDENDIENYDGICTYQSVIDASFIKFRPILLTRWSCITIVIFLNIYILTVVNHHRREIRRYTIATLDKHVKRKWSKTVTEFKTEKMLVLMILAFLVTNLPLDISRVVYLATGEGTGEHSTLMHAIKYLYWSNSFINPIIYALNNSKIAASVKNILCCRHVTYGMVLNDGKITCLSPDSRRGTIRSSKYYSFSFTGSFSTTSRRISIAKKINESNESEKEMSIATVAELSNTFVVLTPEVEISPKKSKVPSWLNVMSKSSSKLPSKLPSKFNSASSSSA